jgi:hypothetical protein
MRDWARKRAMDRARIARLRAAAAAEAAAAAAEQRVQDIARFGLAEGDELALMLARQREAWPKALEQLRARGEALASEGGFLAPGRPREERGAVRGTGGAFRQRARS